ncbi:unnamed protein product, partial [Discosporangium mesarthrocarpum]
SCGRFLGDLEVGDRQNMQRNVLCAMLVAWGSGLPNRRSFLAMSWAIFPFLVLLALLAGADLPLSRFVGKACVWRCAGAYGRETCDITFVCVTSHHFCVCAGRVLRQLTLHGGERVLCPCTQSRGGCWAAHTCLYDTHLLPQSHQQFS